MQIITGSKIYQIIIIWFKSLICIYRQSNLSDVIKKIVVVLQDSYFGRISNVYKEKGAYFEGSRLYNLIVCIVDGAFALGNKIISFIWLKLLKKEFKDSWLSNFKIPYEILTYILALYALWDCLFRKYIIAFSSIWDELFLIIMFFAWAVKGICEKKIYSYKKNPMDSCIAVFMGVFLALAIMSPNLTIAIEGYRVLVQYVLWYFAVMQLLRDKDDAKKLLVTFVCLVGLLGMHGVYQYIIGVEMPETWVESSESIRTRVYSIFTSPNIFGSLLVLASPITVSLMLTEKNIRKKLVYCALFLAMIMALVFTFSRGAWLGLLCAIAVYVLLKDKRLIIPAIIGGIMVLLFVPSISNRFLFMFSSDYISSSLRGGRLVRWLTAIDIVQEHPISGLGIGQFGGAVAMNHDLIAVVDGVAVPTFYMDNNYFKIMAESGIIGIILFMWLMYQIFTISIKTIGITKDKEAKELEMGVLAGLSGVMFHNFVENVFEVPMMTSLFWMLVAVMMHFWYLNYYDNGKRGKEQC